MAAIRNASAHWEGSLTEGAGRVTFESSELGTHDVTWAARANESNGLTSPEELIAAAHSTCYSMSLSLGLAKAGNPAEAIDTKAAVTFVPGTGITGVELSVTGKVPGITAEQFEDAAQTAKEACPVSQALKAVPITLEVHFAE